MPEKTNAFEELDFFDKSSLDKSNTQIESAEITLKQFARDTNINEIIYFLSDLHKLDQIKIDRKLVEKEPQRRYLNLTSWEKQFKTFENNYLKNGSLYDINIDSKTRADLNKLIQNGIQKNFTTINTRLQEIKNHVVKIANDGYQYSAAQKFNLEEIKKSQLYLNETYHTLTDNKIDQASKKEFVDKLHLSNNQKRILFEMVFDLSIKKKDSLATLNSILELGESQLASHHNKRNPTEEKLKFFSHLTAISIHDQQPKQIIAAILTLAFDKLNGFNKEVILDEIKKTLPQKTFDELKPEITNLFLKNAKDLNHHLNEVSSILQRSALAEHFTPVEENIKQLIKTDRGKTSDANYYANKLADWNKQDAELKNILSAHLKFTVENLSRKLDTTKANKYSAQSLTQPHSDPNRQYKYQQVEELKNTIGKIKQMISAPDAKDELKVSDYVHLVKQLDQQGKKTLKAAEEAQQKHFGVKFKSDVAKNLSEFKEEPTRKFRR